MPFNLRRKAQAFTVGWEPKDEKHYVGGVHLLLHETIRPSPAKGASPWTPHGKWTALCMLIRDMLISLVHSFIAVIGIHWSKLIGWSSLLAMLAYIGMLADMVYSAFAQIRDC